MTGVSFWELDFEGKTTSTDLLRGIEFMGKPQDPVQLSPPAPSYNPFFCRLSCRTTSSGEKITKSNHPGNSDREGASSSTCGSLCHSSVGAEVPGFSCIT